jgi:hypothetical protein
MPYRAIIIGATVIAAFVMLLSLLPTVPEAIDRARHTCKSHNAVKSFDANNNVVVCRDGHIFHV